MLIYFINIFKHSKHKNTTKHKIFPRSDFKYLF